MNLTSHDCPLCGGPATYYELTRHFRNYYNCPSCTKFGITSEAQRKINGAGHPHLARAARAVTQRGESQVLDIWWRSTPDDQGLEARPVAKEGYCLPGRAPDSAAVQLG